VSAGRSRWYTDRGRQSNVFWRIWFIARLKMHHQFSGKQG
jgi:hypothetical protein